MWLPSEGVVGTHIPLPWNFPTPFLSSVSLCTSVFSLKSVIFFRVRYFKSCCWWWRVKTSSWSMTPTVPASNSPPSRCESNKMLRAGFAKQHTSGCLWNQWKVMQSHLWDSGHNHKRRHKFKFRCTNWNTEVSLCHTDHRYHERVSPIAVSRHTHSWLSKFFLTLSSIHYLAIWNCSPSSGSVSVLESACCKIAHFPTRHWCLKLPRFHFCNLVTGCSQ